MRMNDVSSSDRVDRRARTARLVAKLAVGFQAFLVCGGWLYRATLYWRIPVAPGDPYGLGDVIELLIYLALLGSSASILGIALVFMLVPTFRRWPAIAALVGAGLLATPLYIAVHAHLPQLVQRGHGPKVRSDLKQQASTMSRSDTTPG